MTNNRIRILLGKLGLDGHERGVGMIAAWLRNAGMEVIYMGTHQRPENMTKIAIEEDVDFIGLSFQGADHIPLTRLMIEQMKQDKLEGRPLVIGGNIPKRDIQILKDMGVAEVFTSGTSMDTIVHYFKTNASDEVYKER